MDSCTHTFTNTQILRITRGHTSKTTKFLLSGTYLFLPFNNGYFPLFFQKHIIPSLSIIGGPYLTESSEQVFISCLFLASPPPSCPSPLGRPLQIAPLHRQNLPPSRKVGLTALILPLHTSDFKEHGGRSLE